MAFYYSFTSPKPFEYILLTSKAKNMLPLQEINKNAYFFLHFFFLEFNSKIINLMYVSCTLPVLRSTSKLIISFM